MPMELLRTVKRSFASLVAVAAIVLSLAGCGTAATNPEAGPTGWTNLFFGFWWLLAVAGSSLALYQAWQFFQWMESQPAGTPDMIRIAGYVQTGADAYLKQQRRVLYWVFGAVCLLLLWMSFGLGVQSGWVPLAFLSGGLFSGLAGWCGM